MKHSFLIEYALDDVGVVIELLEKCDLPDGRSRYALFLALQADLLQGNLHTEKGSTRSPS